MELLAARSSGFTLVRAFCCDQWVTLKAKIRPQAHSDSYWDYPNLYGHTLHVMCECKHKEQGVFALLELMKNKAVA